MCQPRSDYLDPVHGALNEIISAESALNMEPEPQPCKYGPDCWPCYLSHRDKWAEHAMEHLRAAFKLLAK